MRLWMLLGALFFAARCYEGAKPMVQSVLGNKTSASSGNTAAPTTSSTSTTSSRSSQGLRLATWNLEWLNMAGQGVVARNDADLEQLRRYAERLNPDIVAVQEVSEEAALARVFPADRYRIHLAQHGRAQKTGFAYRHGLDVRVMADLDALSEHGLRAGADLAVQVNGKTLRLLAIHLKAFCVKKTLADADEDCARLAEQVPTVEAWIDARAQAGDAFAVLGDFNRFLDDDDELWQALNDGEPSNLTLRRTDPALGSLCKSQRSPRRFIDHIVLGGNAGNWLVPDSFRELRYDVADKQMHTKLSDHCPILVELDRVE